MMKAIVNELMHCSSLIPHTNGNYSKNGPPYFENSTVTLDHVMLAIMPSAVMIILMRLNTNVQAGNGTLMWNFANQ